MLMFFLTMITAGFVLGFAIIINNIMVGILSWGRSYEGSTSVHRTNGRIGDLSHS